MKKLQRVTLCVLVNLATTGVIVLFLVFARGDSQIWQFGPSDDLVVLSVPVNTWPVYISLISISCLLKIAEVGVNDLGTPDLGFSVYDPSVRRISGFTRLQLQLLTNSMWLLNNLSVIFKTVILVSRLDVALISTLAGETASVFTIAYLLRKKEFYPGEDAEEGKERLISDQQQRDLVDIEEL